MLEYRLSSLPSDGEIEASRDRWAGLLEAIQESHLTSGVALANLDFEEKRRIIGLIFGGRDESGRRYGVYITCLGIYFGEFDGPRSRRLHLKVVAD